MLGIVVRVLIVSWVAAAACGIWSIEMRDPVLAFVLACGLFLAVLIGVLIDHAMVMGGHYEP